MQETDAESYRSRSEEGSGFAETSPRTRRRVSFPGVRCSVDVRYVGPSFGGDEYLWGTGVLEGYEVVARGGGGSLYTFILVVKDSSSTVTRPFERPGTCLAMRNGMVRNGSTPDAMAEPWYMPDKHRGGRGVGTGRA